MDQKQEEEENNYNISPSTIYMVHGDYSQHLYVLNEYLEDEDNDVKKYMDEHPGVLVKSPKEFQVEDEYTAFRYGTNFMKKTPPIEGKVLNDCLRLAEELTCGIPQYMADEPVLMEKTTGRIIGQTLGENRQIAIDLESESKPKGRTTRHTKVVKEVAAINEDANPKPGESYGMIRKKTAKAEDCPYHIAHVLFRDEQVNITLEANAGDPNMDYPHFGLYTTDPTDDAEDFITFHRTWHKAYKDGVTIVLTSRGYTKEELEKKQEECVLKQKKKTPPKLPSIAESKGRHHKSPSPFNDDPKKSLSPKNPEVSESKGTRRTQKKHNDDMLDADEKVGKPIRIRPQTPNHNSHISTEEQLKAPPPSKSITRKSRTHKKRAHTI